MFESRYKEIVTKCSFMFQYPALTPPFICIVNIRNIYLKGCDSFTNLHWKCVQTFLTGNEYQHFKEGSSQMELQLTNVDQL